MGPPMRGADGLAAGGGLDEMRAVVCSTLMALIVTTAAAHAQGCTPNHELYRIVPELRAIMLDGGEIKRVMFVDGIDEKLRLWKPGHNITFCPGENKMINTTINSVVTLLSEFATTCKTLPNSDAVDRALQTAWDYTNNQHADPNAFVTEAKSNLGWYYKVCTDHAVPANWFDDNDFKDFLYAAASLTLINMANEDPANESTYKARAAQYEEWRDALYAADAKKSFAERIWEYFTAPHSTD